MRSLMVVAVALVLGGLVAVGHASARPLRAENEVILEAFPVFRQPDPISCGPTCVAMVLRHYGVEMVEDLLRYRGLRSRFEQMPPSVLKDALRDRGIEASVNRGSLNDVVTYLDEGRPVILLLRYRPVLWHYVVVIGHRGRPAQFLVVDPYSEAYWVDGEVLEGAWSYDGDLLGNRYEVPPGDVSAGDSVHGLPRTDGGVEALHGLVRAAVEGLGLHPRLMIAPDHAPIQDDGGQAEER